MGRKIEQDKRRPSDYPPSLIRGVAKIRAGLVNQHPRIVQQVMLLYKGFDYKKRRLAGKVTMRGKVLGVISIAASFY